MRRAVVVHRVNHAEAFDAERLRGYPSFTTEPVVDLIAGRDIVSEKLAADLAPFAVD